MIVIETKEVQAMKDGGGCTRNPPNTPIFTTWRLMSTEGYLRGLVMATKQSYVMMKGISDTVKERYGHHGSGKNRHINDT